MKSFVNAYYFFGKDTLNPYEFFRDVLHQLTGSLPTMMVNINPLEVVETLSTNFTFTFKEQDYQCNYHHNSMDKDDKVFKVTFTLKYSESEDEAALAFSKLIQTITEVKSSEFNMAPTIDSLSIYYSEPLYSKLALYERSMRSLITAIFIPKYKEEWGKNLTDLVKEIKGRERLREGKIRASLENLNLSTLESIFFGRKLKITEENYDRDFCVDNLNTLSKE